MPLSDDSEFKTSGYQTIQHYAYKTQTELLNIDCFAFNNFFQNNNP